ncbi:hypothetical protein Tmar_0378 [Thermaerobacter marianensis DSM 12885]|uniref:DedA family protein n=1 Tax=Thermaerobacter marianensis (strain ATCC 700841 / DSM 12885 / JCM 10246 / 7p75a) TaxID=644966 RepID=E6SG84_THEM7|nr:hypothetical protein [Thermaerobacter marianensis]ADU50501.1 hypothetical protein Tmar_0378 [Thermaerobacter marianensis DSM 12885]
MTAHGGLLAIPLHELTEAGLLAAGFALHSIGIPLTTVALFTLLTAWAAQTDAGWLVAGGLAAAATLAGHALVLGLGRWWGWRGIAAAQQRWGSMQRVAERVDRLARSPSGWAVLTAWRWLGPGFAQAFWVLCTLPRWDRTLAALLAYLALHDVVWSFAWTYALVVLHLRAPAVAVWLDRLAWALLAGTLIWTLASRRRGRRPAAGSSRWGGAPAPR